MIWEFVIVQCMGSSTGMGMVVGIIAYIVGVWGYDMGVCHCFGAMCG